MLSIAFIAVFVSFFPIVFGSFVVFDMLVRREYSLHKRNWVSDGRPIGFFWVPKETTVANGLLVNPGSSLARRKAAYGWVFVSPEWVASDRTARRLLLLLRAMVIGWHAAVAVFAIALFR
jgi:hypothetical protein